MSAFGLVAQSVEQRPFKPLVEGSSPSQPTTFSSFPARMPLVPKNFSLPISAFTPVLVANLLGTLRANHLLHTVREGAGRRPQVLALAELINLFEGRKVF